MEKETLEKVALKLYQYQSKNPPYTIITPKAKIESFIEGAKWQQERMYSEEDMRKAFIAGGNSCIEEDDVYGSLYNAYIENWFEQYN